MRDQDKTKEQLIEELEALRREPDTLDTLSQQKLRALFDAIQEPICAVDLDFNLTDVNEVMLKLYGLIGKGPVLGRKCFEVFKDRKDACPYCSVAEVYETNRPVYRKSVPEELTITEGEACEIFAYPIHDHEGKITGAVEFSRNIAERIRAERVLQVQRDLSVALNAIRDLDEAARRCLKAAIDISGLDCGGIYVLDEHRGLSLAAYEGISAGFAETMAYQQASSSFAQIVMGGEPIYRPALEATPADRQHVISEGLRCFAALPVHHQGNVIAALVVASRTLDDVPTASRHGLGAIAGMIGGAIARIRAEEKLIHEDRLLRDLFDLHERERNFISHEIHDGFLQDVVAAQMLLEANCTNPDSDHTTAADRHNSIRELLGRAIREGRRMISELRPMIIEEKGIVEALKYLTAEAEKDGTFRADFRHDVDDGRLAPFLESAVFRIVQEAVNNAKRHSQADRVEIQLTETEGRLRLEIRDHGIGFEPENVPDDHFGIRGIRERARLLGGWSNIESSPGEGARIVVELPLADTLHDT